MRVDILPFSFRLALSAKETTTWAHKRRVLDYSNLSRRWIEVEVAQDGTAVVHTGAAHARQQEPAREELLALIREHVLLALPDTHPCRVHVKEGTISFTRALVN